MQTAGINVGGAVSVGVAAGTGLIALFILLFVIIVVANRAEPDPRGLRPLSVYLFALTFVMLELAYSGTVLIVTSLFSLIGPHSAPLTNSVARSVVIGAILLVIAGITMVTHLRKGLEIARGDARADGPNARILHTYVSVVTFLYLVTALVSLGLSIYFLFELISPAVFGGGGAGRSAIVEVLLDVLYIMVASGLIVVAHSTLGGPSIFRFEKGAPAGLSVDPQATE